MTPAQRRELIVEILTLIARLEEEPPDEPFGARHAATLLRDGREIDAIAALRLSSSGAIAATGWLIESHLSGVD